jgi:hypothetical protein
MPSGIMLKAIMLNVIAHEGKYSALQERDIWHIIFISVINADYNVFGMLSCVMLNVILPSALAPCKNRS